MNDMVTFGLECLCKARGGLSMKRLHNGKDRPTRYMQKRNAISRGILIKNIVFLYTYKRTYDHGELNQMVFWFSFLKHSQAKVPEKTISVNGHQETSGFPC